MDNQEGLEMLNNAPIMTTIPVVDADRAKKFYTETLGLTVLSEDDGGRVLAAGGGTTVLLYPRGATVADHTVAAFLVEDVPATVAQLRERGVTFEEYDFPGLKTVDGIAEMGGLQAAWFIDTEGNILSVSTNPS